ncbi:MAG: hypothetical protein RLZ77_1105 [Bacteroidota bacterium]|jgi:hypothetical protein
MKKQTPLFAVLLAVLVTASTYAQDLPEFEDDVVDNPVAPIDDYLPLALLTAVGLGWVLLRKKAAQHT